MGKPALYICYSLPPGVDDEVCLFKQVSVGDLSYALISGAASLCGADDRALLTALKQKFGIEVPMTCAAIPKLAAGDRVIQIDSTLAKLKRGCTGYSDEDVASAIFFFTEYQL